MCLFPGNKRLPKSSKTKQSRTLWRRNNLLCCASIKYFSALSRCSTQLLAFDIRPDESINRFRATGAKWRCGPRQGTVCGRVSVKVYAGR